MGNGFALREKAGFLRVCAQSSSSTELFDKNLTKSADPTYLEGFFKKVSRSCPERGFKHPCNFEIVYRNIFLSKNTY